jgi:3-hydroxybutyryl-CoA dehydrogenase
MEKISVAVLGAGTMGSGIAQLAATFGHNVVLYDIKQEYVDKANTSVFQLLQKLISKSKISETEANAILGRINFTVDLNQIKECSLVFEAIIENIEIKQELFKKVENIVSESCVITSNTSSLSIASITSVLKKPERSMGIHFFNPATLMPLVEIIPALKTDMHLLKHTRSIIDSWQKVTVLAKDTPGFIVNRLARPFYGEAIRIYEESIADFATIDWAMKHIGGFKMGPFELMDYIGNDVNYTVTETVFREFFYDPRYKPSFTQKRMMESGLLGRKSGKGYYDYSLENPFPEADKNEEKGQYIFNRIICMLINEAADALLLNVASREDLDLAMTKGVNYPKGLLQWCNELGAPHVLKTLENLQSEYGDDRYRPSPMLRRL